jgi:hypothetical protein
MLISKKEKNSDSKFSKNIKMSITSTPWGFAAAIFG